MSFRSFSQSMISITAISCFFIASAYAALPIPRTDLRLELMVSGSTADTSGNNRLTSFTGTTPTVLTDPTYGIKNWNFGSNGSVRVNTSWTANSTADFTMSFWMKLPASAVTQNTSNNYITPIIPTTTNYNGYQTTVSRITFDKPQVILAAKTATGDTN